MIRVTMDPDRTLVRAEMAGMLTVDEVERFELEKEAAVHAMGLRSGEFLLLVLANGNAVQTQEVMAAFQDLLLHTTVRARRIATVRDGVLTRMQSRRLAKLRPDHEVFNTRDEAERWLFADESANGSPGEAAAPEAWAMPSRSAV